MVTRGIFSGTAIVALLLVIGMIGCSRRLPPVSGPSAGVSDTTTGTQTPQAGSGVSTDSSGARMSGGIEERERRVVEESMRREMGSSQPGTEAGGLTREVFLSEDIRFAYNSFTLSDSAKQILEQKAQWLVANADVAVQIEGHCDERGTVAYNLALGERRANTVKQYIVALGVEAPRLTTISYGEEFPLDPRHNEEAWARNRRAHFAILNP